MSYFTTPCKDAETFGSSCSSSSLEVPSARQFSSPATSTSAASRRETTAALEGKGRGKNWTTEECVGLISAYVMAREQEKEKGERGEIFFRRVTSFFQQENPGTERTTKACTEKLTTIKDMFNFIHDFNGSRIPGSTGKEPWFDLPKKERKEFCRKYKKIDISQDVFDALAPVHETKATVNPPLLIESAMGENASPSFTCTGPNRGKADSEELTAADKFNSGRKTKRRKMRQGDSEGGEGEEGIGAFEKQMITVMQGMVENQRQYMESQRQNRELLASLVGVIVNSTKEQKKRVAGEVIESDCDEVYE